MPKKRKTRKQKVLIDQKRQTVYQTPAVIISQKEETPQSSQATAMSEVTFSLSQTAAVKDSSQMQTKPKALTKTVVVSTEGYGYLGIDLLKTAIVTGAIAITEIIIRILFRG